MQPTDNLAFSWQKLNNHEAKLIRVYGNFSEVRIPSQIKGIPLTEIASYCFSQASQIKEDVIEEEHEGLYPMLGGALTKVVLPKTIRKIGNYVFYNCRNLKEILIGEETREIGSDAFMNCLSLHRLTLTCAPEKRTGLKQILSQISADIEVCFIENEEIKALLFYPEYMESYDEITPAHLFGRNITGEGFRARQGFTEGILDFSMYDSVFQKACVEESHEVLISMASNRILYPMDLKQEAEVLYKGYLVKHANMVMAGLLKKKDLSFLKRLVKLGCLSKEILKEGFLQASKSGYMEGAAVCMEQMQSLEKIESRYEFDEW